MNTLAMKLDSTNGSALAESFHTSLVYIFGVLFLLASNVVLMSKAEAADCGGLNQYACKVTFKRLKACDKGLHKNYKTKRCVRNKRILPPKQKNCGKLNQMACRITVTRPKACDFGLHRDSLTFRCVKNRKILPPKQKNCGKLGQYACKVTATRLKACDLHLVKDKRTNRCRKVKSIIPPKQQNCGKLNQYACKVTVTRPKACDFGLVRDKNTKRCRKMKSVLPPKQTNCGKLGQMACRITVTRPKACDFGLHRDKRTFRCVKNKTVGEVIVPPMKHCGKFNQRACKKWERVVACDKGLRRYPPTGNCVKRKKVNIKNFIKTAKNVKNESFGLIKIMATGYGCYFKNPPAAALLKAGLNGKQKKKGFIKALKKAIKNKDANFGLVLGQSTCIKQIVSQASREGYKTLTIGYSGGGSLGVGAFADNGFAYDIKALNHFFKSPNTRRIPNPTFYQTKAYSGGIQAGLAGGFNLGIFKGSSAADTRGSDTHGVTFEAGAGVGGGTGIWFDYNGKLDGISASAIVGASGKAGAYNRINTSFYNLKGPNVVNCGARNQRACKPWESVPACKKGLKHNMTTGKCHVKAIQVRKLNCGANGQRVSSIQEQVPGCNPGLKIDFKLKRCVYK